MITQLALIALGFIVLTRGADDALKRLVRLSRHSEMSEFAISFVIVCIDAPVH